MKPAEEFTELHLKKITVTFYGSYIGMSGRGESVAREDNYCEIDSKTVDKWGIQC
jgi:hypothetical protein